MEVTTFSIKGPVLVRPKRIEDERGWFSEIYNSGDFADAIGRDVHFVQSNESFSAKKGTLRGLHFQHPPFGQAKLVRVGRGAILDVVVDIRDGSPTFGQHERVRLDSKSGDQLWVPEGFAHGFVTLKDNTVVNYRVTSGYAAQHQGRIAWNDPLLHIDWEVDNPTLSDADRTAPSFADLVSPFGIRV